MTLKRSLGVLGLLSAALGGIIGSGWLFGPYFAVKVAGPAAVVSWVLGGGLMMIIALTFSELGSSFPWAGGSARYLHLSHGNVVGFGMAWVIWLASVAVSPVETLALLHYASSYLPALLKSVHGQVVLTYIGFCVATGILALLCLINTVPIHQVSKTNVGIVVLKLAVPLFTAIALLDNRFNLGNFTAQAFAPVGFKGILSALPTAGVIFSFIGYSPAIQLAGEAKNPQRAIPIAVMGALLICIILYVILQIAFVGALAPASFKQGWQNLQFQGDVGPFAGIAIGMGFFWLAKILYADAVLSPFGTALIYTTATARLAYAMTSNHYFPPSLVKLNKHGMPTRILLVNFVLGVFLFLPFPTWQNMVAFLVSALVFAYAIGPLALIVLRQTLPNYPRPFKLPCVKLICFLAFYICNLILYWSGWQVIFKTIVALTLGYVFYIFRIFFSNMKPQWNMWKNSAWFFCYVLLIALFSYVGAFGGLGWLPFGWDFIVMAGITALIFFWALKRPLTMEATQRELERQERIHESPAGE